MKARHERDLERAELLRPGRRHLDAEPFELEPASELRRVGRELAHRLGVAALALIAVRPEARVACEMVGDTRQRRHREWIIARVRSRPTRLKLGTRGVDACQCEAR